jgi:hypothetical protein
MATKILAGVLVAAVLGLTGGGLYLANGQEPATAESCCYPGSPCCVAGAACCDTGDCCVPGADCSAAGASCCEASVKDVTAKASKDNCCEAGAACCDVGGGCCGK